MSVDSRSSCPPWADFPPARSGPPQAPQADGSRARADNTTAAHTTDTDPKPLAVTPEAIAHWVDELAGSQLPDDDAQRVELLSALEHLTNAAQAAQSRTTAVFDASQRSEQAARGVPAARRGRGIAGQVALARQVSPHNGQQLHQLALILDRELPATADVFRRGLLSQRRAQIIARETAMLSAEHRARVDREVAGDVDRLTGKGDRELAGECARWAALLDPVSVVARRRKAESERHVGLRPAPDTMSRMSALLPVADGVAVFGALSGAADSARAQGDDRSRGQVMADTLVSRVLGRHRAAHGDTAKDHSDPAADNAAVNDTGQPRVGRTANTTGHTSCAAEAPDSGTRYGRDDEITWASCDMNNQRGQSRSTAASSSASDSIGSDSIGPNSLDPNSSVSASTAAGDSANDQPANLPDTVAVMLNVVLTDAQLFGGADGAARLEGHGPIDAELARELAHHHRAWLRRTFADPAAGSLIGLESCSRLFPPGLRTLVRLRDGTCRTPWCDAPVRHIDHAVAHQDRGPTAFHNGQGLCENCDYTKQAPGWHAQPIPVVPPDLKLGEPHDIETSTPTGHRYRSPAPSRVTPAGASGTGAASTPPRMLVLELRPPPFPVEVELAA